MTRIYFSGPAEHDAKRLPISARNALRSEHIPALVENRHLGKPLHGPLRGFFSYEFWAAGVSYRISYEIVGNDVVIMMVDTRDNYYKKLRRRVS